MTQDKYGHSKSQVITAICYLSSTDSRKTHKCSSTFDMYLNDWLFIEKKIILFYYIGWNLNLCQSNVNNLGFKPQSSILAYRMLKVDSFSDSYLQQFRIQFMQLLILLQNLVIDSKLDFCCVVFTLITWMDRNNLNWLFAWCRQGWPAMTYKLDSIKTQILKLWLFTDWPLIT